MARRARQRRKSGRPEADKGADGSDLPYREALDLHRQGRLGEAIEAYLSALAKTPENAEAHANLASACRGAGRLDEAIEHYREALRIDESSAPIWFNLGNAFQAAGRDEDAGGAFERAIALDPAMYQAHFNLGNVLRDGDRLEDAAARYGRAVELAPELARAHTNLGNVLRRLGRTAQAIDAHRRAVAAEPDYADAHYNLGNALADDGERDEALLSYRRALERDPGLSAAALALAAGLRGQSAREEAESVLRRALERAPDEGPLLRALGDLLQGAGRAAEAIPHYRRALAIEPGLAEVHNAMGVALRLTGDEAGARAAIEEAIRLAPDLAEAHSNLGTLHQRAGRIAPAIACFEQALALNPDLAIAHANLGFALYLEGRIAPSIKHCRRAIEIDPTTTEAHINLGTSYANHGRLAEAEAAYREAIARDPANLGTISNLLFVLNYSDAHDAAEIAAQHRRLGDAWTSLDAAPARWPQTPDPDRTLRLGYLSPDLRRHPVGYFIEPLLDHHDRAAFDVVCYSTSVTRDAFTDRLRALGHTWRDVAGWDDERLARQVREDAVDVLVDLAGHTANNGLGVVARRVAPVQASYLGYPSSTGLAAVDCLIADGTVCPPDKAALYSERVQRLPHCFLCVRPPDEAPAVAPPPSLRRGRITFGSFNHLPKVTGRTVALWSRLLREVPGSRLVLKSRPFADGEVRAHYAALFADRGIEGDRLDLLPPVPFARMLADYSGIDIALDPVPYTGGTTTCQALWMGVPVVTLIGESFASRMGASILGTVGLDGLIAGDEDAYIATAAGLAADAARLESLRLGMRERLRASPLCDETGFTRDFENACRAMWRAWCATDG